MQKKGSIIFFSIQWLIIGFISAFDSYCSIKYRDFLYEFEQNPIGRYLIELDNGDVSLFIMIKIMGTILTLGILILLFLYNSKIGQISCFGVCTFQLFLLIYLCFAKFTIGGYITNAYEFCFRSLC